MHRSRLSPRQPRARRAPGCRRRRRRARIARGRARFTVVEVFARAHFLRGGRRLAGAGGPALQPGGGAATKGGGEAPGAWAVVRLAATSRRLTRRERRRGARARPYRGWALGAPARPVRLALIGASPSEEAARTGAGGARPWRRRGPHRGRRGHTETDAAAPWARARVRRAPTRPGMQRPAARGWVPRAPAYGTCLRKGRCAEGRRRRRSGGGRGGMRCVTNCA